MPRDPRVDAYIAARADFARPILIALRDRLHEAAPGLDETIKWGMPAFVWQGRPLASMAAFKHHASFGLWDREGMKTGREGDAMGQFGRITSIDDLPDAAAFAAMVARACAAIAAGARPARAARAPRPDPVVPPALAAALADNPAAAAAFSGFPPGARRDYCEWIAEAKRPETRDRRVAEAIQWLADGKKRNWKYEAC